jgi:hypothetical protein
MALGRLFSFGKSKEEKFWGWFAANADKLAQVKDGSEPVVKATGRAIDAYNRELAWTVGNGEGRHLFIISAEGIAANIPIVKRLVDAAPAIPGWQVIAFRPRDPEVERVQVNNITVALDDVFFSEIDDEPDDSHLHLRFFVSGLDANDPDPHCHGVFLLLDTVIGEYDVMTKLGALDFAPITEVDGRQRPLRDLVALVDARS